MIAALNRRVGTAIRVLDQSINQSKHIFEKRNKSRANRGTMDF